MPNEPVNFAMLAAQLRLGSDTSEQTLIEGYILAAREWVEDYTGHLLVQREVTDHFGTFERRLRLSKRPLLDVISIDYLDGDGVASTYTGFDVRTDGQNAYIHASSAGWPARYRPGAVSITYTAGYAPMEAPQRFIQAIQLLAGDFYRNRSSGSLSPDVDRAVSSLLRSFRRRTL